MSILAFLSFLSYFLSYSPTGVLHSFEFNLKSDCKRSTDAVHVDQPIKHRAGWAGFKGIPRGQSENTSSTDVQQYVNRGYAGEWSLVQFSSVMSDSLRPHELQHARPPCPSPTPGVHPSSCTSSWWCHPAISSSVVPFSSCPQSLPASGSSPMSQLFAWGGQSIGVSALASVLPKNTQVDSYSCLFLLISWQWTYLTYEF